MQLLLTLDYELFFGTRTGTVDHCLIKPTDDLAEAVEAAGGHLVLFVDAGFLVACEREGDAESLDRVSAQLARLTDRGHEVQLHIHPHWEDCRFRGGQWHIDTSRYQLHDFNAAEQADIVRRYADALDRMTGQRCFAYRAGGWCCQPFDAIGPALQARGIWLDSTVFPGGRSEDNQRGFDFRAAPTGEHWQFSKDPLQPDSGGPFTEVPISAIRVSPRLFWGMLMNRKTATAQDRPYGDGAAIRASAGYYLRRLTAPTIMPASIDGSKGRFLDAGLHAATAAGQRIYNVMGHPKSVTPAGVAELQRFLQNSGLAPTTFTALTTQLGLTQHDHLKPATAGPTDPATATPTTGG